MFSSGANIFGQVLHSTELVRMCLACQHFDFNSADNLHLISSRYWRTMGKEFIFQFSRRSWGTNAWRTPKNRADKGWAVKRARPSKKVWCSRMGLCLEMSLVFDFGHGLRCGLYIRHCRCHWIMAAWFVFLHFFLVHLCWYAVSERQMLPFLCGRF